METIDIGIRSDTGIWPSMQRAVNAHWSSVLQGTAVAQLHTSGGDAGTPAPSSPTKSGKGQTKRGGQSSSVGAQQGIAAEIPPILGAAMFTLKDALYVVGANTVSGTLECYSVSQNANLGASTGRGSSPKKESKKQAAASGTTVQKGDGSVVICTKPVPCGGKAPPSRCLFASCCGYAAPSASSSSNPSESSRSACEIFFDLHVSSVFVSGGRVPAGVDGAALDDLWELKVPQFSWQQVNVKPPLISKRFHHAIAHVQGRIYLFGGRDPKLDKCLGDFWMLEDHGAQGRRWSPVIHHGLCSSGSSTGVDDHSVYDCRRPCAREQHVMAPAPGGALLLYGGVNASGEVLNDLWFCPVAHSVYTSEGAVVPLVAWRRITLFGCGNGGTAGDVPRRLGCSLLLLPVPEEEPAGPQAGSVSWHRAPTSRAVPNSFLMLLCGGWDAERLNPFPQITTTMQGAAVASPSLNAFPSNIFSSHGSFGSIRDADDGATAPRWVGRTLAEQPNTLTAQRSSLRASSALAAAAGTPSFQTTVKEHPVVIAYMAAISDSTATAADDAKGPMSDAIAVEYEIPVVAVEGDSESGCSRPSRQREALRGDGRRGLAPAAAVAANACRLLKGTFSRIVERATAPSPSLDRPLGAPPTMRIVACLTVESSGTARAQSAQEGSVSLATSTNLGTTTTGKAVAQQQQPVSTSPGGVGGTTTGAGTYNRSHQPICAMHALWCRGAAAVLRSGTSSGGGVANGATELFAFGGDMGPAVQRSDLWRCNVRLADWGAARKGSSGYNSMMPFTSL